MKLKTTNKLFLGKYPYKVVFRVAGASYLCGRDTLEIAKNINNIDLRKNAKLALARKNMGYYYSTYVTTPQEQQVLLALNSAIDKLSDYKKRQEGGTVLSVYCMLESEIDMLVATCPTSVQYVSKPRADVTLSVGTVALPKLKYKYRVNIRVKSESYESFVNWATSMGDKVKLPDSCKRRFRGNIRSWESKHSFLYVKDTKELMIARLQLGDTVVSVEENVMYKP